MLKKRILTAACLIPPVLWCVLVPIQGEQDPIWLGIKSLAALLFLGAGFEWARLTRLPRSAKPWFLGLLLLGLVGGVFYTAWVPIEWILWLSLLWWLAAARMVFKYQRSPFKWSKPIPNIGVGLCLLLPAYFSFIYLKELPYPKALWMPYTLLYPMLIVWVADSGAYFMGRRWGRHPFMARISPGKTREGFVGALLSVAAFAWLVYAFQVSSMSPLSWLLWSLGIALFSVLGDLLESLFKRMHGVKDSGSLLPGHGGILDRLDSLLAALPMAALGLMLIRAWG